MDWWFCHLLEWKASLHADNLNIETVQNSTNNSNRTKGGNIGIGFGKALTGNIGANKGQGKTNSITASEQSGIIFSSDDHNLTAINTSNISGILANVQTDEQGNKSNGNLNFTTDTLVTENLTNSSTQDARNIGSNIGTGNVNVQLGHTGNEYESQTLATIGTGAVVTSDAITGKDSLAGVNRDALNTEKVIKDITTGALAVDSSMDTRVFTEGGREKIADEQGNLTNNVKATGKIIAGGVLHTANTGASIVTGDKTLAEAKTSFTAPDKMANVIKDNPKIGAILQAYQQGDYQGLLDSQQALQLLADSTGVSVDVIVTTVTNELGKKGTTDNNITAIDVTENHKKDVLTTLGHEVVGHNLGGENEKLADLSGVVTDLLVSAGMDSVQDDINKHKATLGDGRDAVTQAENKTLLDANNSVLVEELEDHADGFMDKGAIGSGMKKVPANAVSDVKIVFMKNDKGHDIICINIWGENCQPRAGLRLASQQEIDQGARDFVLNVTPVPGGGGGAVKYIVQKGKTVLGEFRDAKKAKKALENAVAEEKRRNGYEPDNDLLSYTKNKDIRDNKLNEDANYISTAKSDKYPPQVTSPRNIQEQILWNRVVNNPKMGRKLENMNYDNLTGKSDPRFPKDAGFQKMEAVMTSNDGKKVIIHYQYNIKTNKAYDVKIVSAY